MKILQAESFPLLGKRLIEASAGTGKTYTIANLYLRVLLGDHALGLKPVDRILVVTFTRAATEELRGRIRDRIRQLYEDVLRLEQDPDDSNNQIDPYIKGLIASTKDNFYSEEHPKKLLLTQWLQANLAQMDESSVFTIHGFCQRILKQFAFDSGVGFESEMILDAQEYLRRAAQDYWRELAYPMDQDQLGALLGNVKNPEDVFKKVRGWLQQENVQLLPRVKENLNFSTAWQLAKDSYDAAAQEWQNLSEQDANDLIESSGVNKKSFTKKTRPKRVAAAKNFFANANFSGSIPEDVLALGQENLFEKTKKGAAPEHKAFRLIDQLAQHCDDMVAVLPHHMLEQVKTKFWASMEQANLMNPDDLLRLLANALRGSHGEALADHIRQQYPFAMIDEFQDTDSLQYEIFNQVYSKEDSSGLYMIGDPKQAIYSFRGADIFTYLKAAQSLNDDSRFTLNKNWRSHSDLVAATNTLFSRHNEPFVLPGKIEFQSVLSAGKSDEGYFHYRAGDAKPVEKSQENKPAPLTLLLNSEGVNRDHGRYNAAAMCANSIQQLLLKGCLNNKQSSDSGSGSEKEIDEPVTAGDIAVLVHNRKQAKLVKENLKKYGINSVFLSRDSVLDSVEARDLLRWLAAIAEPQNERLFRSALACESLAYDAHYLASLLTDEALWEVELAQLYELRDRFNQRGVMAFIMALLNKAIANKGTENKETENKGTENSEPLAVRLRKQADGERKLTNFLHLGEMLQQASRELGIQSGFYNTDGKGLLTILRWYTERCQNAVLHQSEEQQIRLESDANLVQIVTIHKSKGLQYPVVFLPFLWDEDHSSTRHGVMYHSEVTNEDESIDTVLTIDTKPDEAAKKKHISEVRAEAMRLLYVALTRAEQACFVQIENVQKYSKGTLINSAIGYLLEQKEVSIDALTERFSDVIEQGKLALFYYNDWLAQLDTVPSLVKAVSTEKPALTLAKFKGRVWDNWRLTSYSQLAKLDSRLSLSDSGTQFDVDAEDLAANVAQHNKQSADEVLENADLEGEVLEGEVLEGEVLENDKALTPFDFPKGASPGTCLHNILENWDFTSTDTLEEQVTKQLTFYGISADLVPMTVAWMQQVVAQPLANAQCCLADISGKDRLVEMEFYLPMTEIRASGVMPLLDGRRLAFEPMRGQLKGFIDLIFRHEGRYYLADYKSNYLGDTIQQYHPAALKDAMEHHQYDLQYWIYSIAVDQYLSRRIPNYDYETHFGGIYYFFLRGMSGSSNKELSSNEASSSEEGKGVFFTRPEKSQLEKWKAWLLGTVEEVKESKEVKESNSTNTSPDNNTNNDSQQLGLF